MSAFQLEHFLDVFHAQQGIIGRHLSMSEAVPLPSRLLIKLAILFCTKLLQWFNVVGWKSAKTSN